MTRRIALTHTIEHRFARPVQLATHWLRLRPVTNARARVTAYSLRVDAAPHFLNWVRDAFENHVARLDLPEPVARLTIEVALVAELAGSNPLDFLVDPACAEHPFSYDAQLGKELAPCLRVETPSAEHAAWLGALARAPAYVVDRLRAVAGAVHDRSAGSPWERAWLLTVSFRLPGIAARFTSGHRIAGAAASVHAWSEAYLPGAGWVGLDPADGLFTAGSHIPLACTPEPIRALPIPGFREACDETSRRAVHGCALRSRQRAPPARTARAAKLRHAAARDPPRPRALPGAR